MISVGIRLLPIFLRYEAYYEFGAMLWLIYPASKQDSKAATMRAM